MSDTSHTDPPAEERLRYAGGTTRHDGPADEHQKLAQLPAEELNVDDLQPGVSQSGGAQSGTPNGADED